MNRILLAALVPAALSVAGCGAFNVEASQPQACLQLVSPQAFIVVPPVIPGGSGKLSSSVNIGLRDAFPKELVNGSPDDNVVRFLGATIALNGPLLGGNARWVKGLKVTATSPTLPPLVLVDYTPPAGGQAGMTFDIGPRDPNNNIITMLQTNGGLTLDVEVSYDIADPPAAGTWTAGFGACFSASIKKTFQQLIDGT